MRMKNILTITSKGQTTLPVTMRKKLGITKSGGILHVTFNEQRGEVVITKPLSIEELSNRVSRNIKPGVKPVTNVDDYYQTHRRAN
jgi:bifunctional DNA-binding transcriptional regulator/antitoxin component of YhaV-PrlF toxin-antitoxin module